MAAKTQPRKRAGPRDDRRPAQELPLLPGQGRRRSTTRTSPSSGATSRRRARSAPPHHGRVPPPPAPGRGRGQAGARDGAPAVRAGWRDGGHPPPGRREARPAGEVVDVARGYARNYLLPRRLAEMATPARVAELRRIDAERARHEARTAEQAQRDRRDARQDRAALRGEGRPDRLAVRLGHADRHRRRDLADAEDPRRPAQDRPRRRSSGSAATRSRSHVFEGVTAEVKTLVVPEGGELPPEEELAALEAAERRRGRGRGRGATPRRGRGRPRRRRAEDEPSGEPAESRTTTTTDAAAVRAPRASDERAPRGALSRSTASSTLPTARSSAGVDERTKSPQRAGTLPTNSFARLRWTTVSGVGDSMGTYVPFSLLRATGPCGDASRLDAARPDGFDAAVVSTAHALADGRGAAAEPRGRGVGPRRDAALADRDRRGQRDPRRVRLLPREPREDLPRRARALGEGRAGRRDHARERARGARRARGRRRAAPGSPSSPRSSRRRRTSSTTRGSSRRWRRSAG